MTEWKKHYGFLEGERICLREVRLDDVTETYYGWLSDPEINKYLESRFYPQSLEVLKDFVRSKLTDDKNVFFAIILKDNNRHIGNIKLGPINTIHRFADIGILIGEKDCWGKGYGAEAIRLIVKYAFDVLNLHKVTAGCYAPNVQGIKAFEKVGFLQEGVRKGHYYYDGTYVDVFLFGLIKADGNK